MLNQSNLQGHFSVDQFNQMLAPPKLFAAKPESLLLEKREYFMRTLKKFNKGVLDPIQDTIKMKMSFG